MYFESRVQAGKLLAAEIAKKYRFEDCAVVALSDGGVVVGAQIAAELHCVLTMLLTEGISLPGEPMPIAAVDQDGGFTYNGMYSAGQLEEFKAEFHGVIEQEKLQQMHKLNRLLSHAGIINSELLREHVVILVSDGLNSGHSLDAAANYLKPIRIKKLVIATPFASVPAVDRMHLQGDDIFCLNVLENYMGTDHYYDQNQIPDHESIVKTIQDIILRWK